MKKLLMSQLLLLFIMSVALYSCKSDKENPTPELLPKLDGFYVYGTNTIASSATDPNARMSLAILDPSKGAKVSNLDSVYGKFMYIGANSKIKFANVIDEVGITYGADGGGSLDSASVVGNSPIKDVVIHGTLKANAPEINVVAEGLYYTYVNLNTAEFILMKVRGNMIGDATVLQWAKGTFFQQAFLSKDSAAFEGTNIQLKEASGYRYRFNDGWATYEDGNVVVLGSLGVFSYGTAWDTGINDIGFFLDNIPQKTTGLFTVRLSYNAATGEWTEHKKKTGEVLIDYTNTLVGLEGNAYKYTALDTGAFAGSGLDGYEVKKPSKSGNVYTWTWSNVKLIQGREFIFLQEAKWGAGLQVDASSGTNNGQAITDKDIIDATADPIKGQYHNFYVMKGVDITGTGPTYDLTLVVDASTSAKTVTIKRH